jgi:ABC-type uncharacterized transport system ATPase subunit
MPPEIGTRIADYLSAMDDHGAMAIDGVNFKVQCGEILGVAGVLLISEDLDELLELSDRIVVMSEGRIVFETPSALADRHQLGAYMDGAQHEAATPKTRTS